MFYGFQRWREAFFLACVFGVPELGLLWCLAFSDPLPTSFIFVSVQVIGCLSATVLYLCFFYGFEAAVSAPCGRVANASFLACPSSACSGVWPFRIRCQQFRHHVEGLRTHRFWLAFFLACVLHALGTKLAAVRGFRKLRIGAFCLAWARILLLFGRFAWAPSRHHGTSADGLAWALLSAPPRHLALRYTGFGPSLAARVLATRKNVLWIPKVTGSIFSGLCFWRAWARPVVVFGFFGSVAHELHFCVCAGYRLLICYGPLPMFFLRLRSCSFGTVWKGCERIVFGLPELGL